MRVDGPWGDLAERLITGGLATGLGLGLMWIGGLPFKLLVSVVAGIMIWEMARMVGADRRAVLWGLAGSAVMVALAIFPIGLALPLVFVPAFIGFTQLKAYRLRFSLFASAILVAGIGIFALREDFGFVWMLWLAAVVIASDVLGYFAGRILGGPKLWSKVSPKKTWSGTVAGWIGAAVIGACYWLSGQAGVEIIGISIAIAIAGQLGDIAESAMKRTVGVKDSSAILPGHGGLLDRFDSMLGAALFLLLVAQIVDFPPVPL